MGRLPIRLRLTIWYSSILLVALAAIGAGAWVAARDSLLASVDLLLRDRAAEIGNVLHQVASEGHFDESIAADEVKEYAQDAVGTSLMQVLGPDGRLLIESGNSPIPWKEISGHSGVRTIGVVGREYQVMAERVDIAGASYTVLTAVSLERVNNVLRRLALVLAWSLPVVAVLASAGGYWISRRALAPVAAMTSAARSITIHNLSGQLPVPPARDELRNLAEAWNETLSKLRASVNRLSQFTADASHELRTPVAVIRAASEVALRRPQSPEEYREALSRVHAESERMSALVEDLLTLARADVENQALPMAPVDVTALLLETAAEGTVLAGPKGVKLESHLPQAEVLVSGNATALRRLLWILIDNAVKYTPAGGRVTIALEQQPGEARIVVSDTGIGMRSEVIPHIFERFYRADNVRDPQAGGSGLGLSIARWIAGQHRATITVASRPGVGSKFAVIFPTK